MPLSAHSQPTPFCPGSIIPLNTIADYLPFAHLRVGSVEGWFLLDTATTFGELDAKRYGLKHGARLRVEDASLPTFEAMTFRALDTGGRTAPSEGAAGSIGTDLFRSRTLEFHYEATPPYAAISRTPCPAATLRSAGFAAIGQAGFYQFGRPGEPRFRDAGGHGLAIPVVFLRIGSVTVPAWIDSGFSESATYPPPGTIRINQAAFDAISQSGLALSSAGSVENTNCDNQVADEPLWRVGTERLQFVDQDGQAIRDATMPLLQIALPHSCGGPGAQTSPLALLGAVYLARWGTAIFDPLNGAVWIRRAP